MAGPWEKYQTEAAAGPWQKYQNLPDMPSDASTFVADPEPADTGLNVPEAPKTIQAQTEAVKEGRKPAVMFPTGTEEPPLPTGMSRVRTRRGTFHFDPTQTTAEFIRRKSNEGKENEILGLGKVSKPEVEKRIAAGEKPVAVTERAPDGTEIKTAVGTPSTLPDQLPTFAQGMAPESTIGVEAPENVIASRLQGMGPQTQTEMPVPINPLDDPGRYRNINPSPITVPGSDMSQRNMLTGDEAYAELKAKQEGAAAALADAQKRMAIAEQNYRRVAPDVPPGEVPSQRLTAKSFGDMAVVREYQVAKEALAEAEAANSAAQRAIPPTMNAPGSAMDAGITAAITLPPDTIAGIMRPFDSIVKDTGVANGIQKWSERITRQYGGDPTRANEFGQKVGQAIGSAIGFVVTGAAGRAAGVSSKLAAGGAGAFSEAEQSYREAARLGKDWKVQTKAYLAGLGIGATEAAGIGSLLDRMNSASGGGVRRYIGLMLAEGGEEAAQEALQTLLGNLRDKGILGKKVDDLSKDVLENALIGALVGAGMAGTLNLHTVVDNGPTAEAINNAAGVDAPAPLNGDILPPETVKPQADAPRLEDAAQTARDVTPPPAAAEPAAPVDKAAPKSDPVASTPTFATDENSQQNQTGVQPVAEPFLTEDDANVRVLRAGGYSDEDIADMPPGNRQYVADSLREQGIEDPGPGAAPSTSAVESGDINSSINNVPSEGTRTAPVKVEDPQQIDQAAAVVNTQPTEKQKEAGNYQHAHINFDGLDIAIETPKGAERTGTDQDGERWSVVMPAHYGRIKRTKGADGDQVDITIGDQPANGKFYVIDQMTPNKTGKATFDEHKVIAGVGNSQGARYLYNKMFSDGSGPFRFGGLTELTTEEFKDRLANWTWDKPMRQSIKSGEKTPAKKGNPQSLAAFIKQLGGVKDFKGELKHFEAHKMLPGMVNNKSGMDLDRAREAAAEAGYLPMESTVADFLNLLRDGRNAFLAEDADAVAAMQDKKAEAEATDEAGQTRQLIVTHLLENENLTDAEIDDELLDIATRLVMENDNAIESAYDRAYIVAADESPAATEVRDQIDDIDFPDIQAATPAKAGKAGARDLQKPESQSAGQGKVGEAGADNAEARPQQVEPGADGKPQTVIPGAERIPDKKLAEMQADKPMRPNKPQKDAGGLFSDEADQGDLLDQTKSNSTARSDETLEWIYEDIAAGRNDASLLEDHRSPEAAEKYLIDNGWKVEGGGKTKIFITPDGKGQAFLSTTVEGNSQQIQWRPRDQESSKKPLTNKEIGDIFDDVLAEETGTPKKSGKSGAKKAAKSAAKNAAMGLDEVTKGLAELFGAKPNKFHSGLDFNKENYEKAKPFFIAGVKHFAQAGRDIKEMVRALIKHLMGQGFDGDTIASMKPFAVQFIQDVQQGKIDLDQEAAPAAGNLSDAVAQHFADGNGFRTIIEARKFAKENGAADLDVKQVEEAIELGVVKAARKIVEQGKSPAETYADLVDLYGRQPRLGTRTGTSVAEQAYSTPVPLSYLAAQAAGIDQDSTVYEPSAGNGALLITAAPDNVAANEINANRRAQLQEQGFDPLNLDASAKQTRHTAMDDRNGGKFFDAMIANPPFGTVRSEQGGNRKFDMGYVQPGYMTGEIDHAIALEALQAMKPDGSAVLILGGINKLAKTDEARSDGYSGKAKREFYKVLYDNYGVVDHFTVAGELYERQGAGYPVDVIVIRGNKSTGRPLPAVQVPKVYSSWDALAEKIGEKYDEGRVDKPAVPDAVGAADNTAGATDAGNLADTGGSRGGRGSRAGGGRAGVRGSGVAGEQQPAVAGDRAEPGDTQQSAGRTDAGGFDRGDFAQRRPSGVNEAVSQEEETEGQVAYTPKSESGNALGTLVPANMKTSTANALDALKAKHGDIDAYVAEALDMSAEDLYDAFAGEQIDAVALAVDNISQGKALIIGDQTGIGKGRVNAAIIRYALVTGKTPIFVTEKPNLYSDMVRDMADIGVDKMLGRDVNILMTNSGESIPLDEEGTKTLKSAGSAKHNKLLADIARAQALPSEYDTVFTTYSQLQTVKEQRTVRHDLLDALIGDAILILDESHNAGGSKAEDSMIKESAGSMDRASFVRDMVARSQGVFYSSATYAKRPEVMDLYSKTDMRLAVTSIDQLAGAINSGGIPMQQAVAAMLAETGQYIRRERSFAGVTYDTPVIPVDTQSYEAFSAALRAVDDFSRYVKIVAKGMAKEAKAEAAMISPDGSTGGAGVGSTNFTSVMHNLISQMLLSVKAPIAAQRAVEALKNGEKPVLTVSNTMGQFIDEYAADNMIGVGQPIDLNFRDLLVRYLDKTRTVTKRKPFMKKGEEAEKIYLTDQQLGETGLFAYSHAMSAIEKVSADMPISPIDFMYAEIEKAGYSVSEITGRSSRLIYKGKSVVLDKRDPKDISPGGRRKVIDQFNSGKIDAIILNRAGSTGLSLHASTKFKNQNKRRMFLVQAEADINQHMQMLGRVHRTGQVITPAYEQLVADIPAERRPAAVLAKKMASLNASTTASRKGALTSDSTPDFMNKYGDKVAVEYLQENPDIARSLDVAIPKDSNDGVMRKLTGRIPMLPLKKQLEVYDTLEENYRNYIEELEEAGESTLEAKRLELDAVLVESKEVAAGTGTGPFERAVHAELLDVKRQKKPLKAAAVAEMIAKPWKMDDAPTDFEALAKIGYSRAAETIRKVVDDFKMFKIDVVDNMASDEAGEKARKKLDDNFDRWNRLSAVLVPGNKIAIDTGEEMHIGIVTGVSRRGKAQNPIALGSWSFTMAIPGQGTLTLSWSRVDTQGNLDEEAEFAEIRPSRESYKDLATRFDVASTAGRERRVILTGNVLKAFAFKPGQIVNFVMQDGRVRQGVMLGPKFDKLAGIEKSKKIDVKTGQAAVEAALAGQIVKSNDGIEIANDPLDGSFTISVPAAKSKGGVYFLNPQVLRALKNERTDFFRSGKKMVAKGLAAHTVADVVDAFIAESAGLYTEQKDAPQAMAAPRARRGVMLTADAREAGLDAQHLADVVEEVANRVTGGRADVRVLKDLWVPEESLAAGGYARGEPRRAMGMYYPGQRVIEIAMGMTDPRNTAHHEAFHLLQDIAAMTAAEEEVLVREAPRLRRMLESFYGPEAQNLSQIEVEAGAYGFYAAARDAGQSVRGFHIGLQRLFERIYQIMRQIRNYLQGMGFQTAEDIFERARTGEMGSRQSRSEARGGVPQPMAATRRPMQLAVPEQGTASKVMQATVDRMVRLQELERALTEATGQQVPQAYKAEARSYSRTENRVDEFHRLRIVPLLEKIKGYGFTNEDVHLYLYANHALVRNDIIRNRYPGDPNYADGGSGMMDADANAILARWGNDRRMQDIANDVQRIVDEDRRRRVNGGLMTQQQADAWEQTFGDTYVPLQGWEGFDGENIPHAGSGQQVRGRESQNAFGRSSMAGDILANLFNNTVEGIARVEKNRVGNEVLRLARMMEATWGRQSPMQVVQKAPLRKILDPQTGVVIEIPDRSFKNEPDYFTTKVGGKEIAIHVKELPLAAELKNLLVSPDDLPMRTIAEITRVYSKMRTVWNPAFAPVNFTRDLQEALIAVTSDPDTSKREFMKQLPLAMGEAAQWILLGRENRMHQNFRLDGGKIAFSKIKRLDDFKREIDTKLNGKKLHRHALDPVIHILENWSDFFELSVRYALYKTAIASGKPRADAATLALEGTLNFYRSGSGDLMKTARALFPFINPATQSPVRAARLIIQAGGLSSSTGRTMLTARGLGMLFRGGAKTYLALVPLGFLVEALNYMLGGEDDDGIPWIEKVDEWRRERGLIIYTGKKNNRGEPEAINISSFPELMLPIRMGQGFARMIWGSKKNNTLQWQAKNMLHAMWKMSPLEGRQVGPAIGSAAMQIYANKNFFGGPIYRMPRFNERGTPDAYVAWDSTPDAWKKTAQRLNSMTGGNEAKSGFADFHPEVLRLLTREAVGGWYNMAEWAGSGMGIMPDTGQPNPFIRPFMVPGRAHRRYETENMMKVEGEQNAKRQEIKRHFEKPGVKPRLRLRQNRQQREQIEAAGAIVGRRGGIKLQTDDIFATARAELADIRRKMQTVRLSDMSPAEKNDRIDFYSKQQATIRKRYTGMAEKLKAGTIVFDDIKDDLRDRRRELRRPQQ